MILVNENKIVSIECFPNEKKLIIKTERIFGNRVKYVNIIFFDVYAYSFNELGEENIIDEVTENPVLGFLHWYYTSNNSQRQSEMQYDLPFSFADKTTALNALEGIYNYYEINAFIGMDGWIIAKKIEIWEVTCGIKERKTTD
ncbi:MAG: hypothetical protein LUH21_21585 [Clostridiales bacterium]|nr:hypothetical protein [Clostridiales bacterium]